MRAKFVCESKLFEYSDSLRRLHKAKSSEERDEIKRDLRKKANWSFDDSDYMLNKFRREIGYEGPEYYEEIPEPEPEIQEPVVSKPSLPKWTEAKYQRWLEDMAPGDGGESFPGYHYDMAQNALYEPGLIEFLKKKIAREGGNESPLERVQWDMEALF